MEATNKKINNNNDTNGYCARIVAIESDGGGNISRGEFIIEHVFTSSSYIATVNCCINNNYSANSDPKRRRHRQKFGRKSELGSLYDCIYRKNTTNFINDVPIAENAILSNKVSLSHVLYSSDEELSSVIISLINFDMCHKLVKRM